MEIKSGDTQFDVFNLVELQSYCRNLNEQSLFQLLTVSISVIVEEIGTNM